MEQRRFFYSVNGTDVVGPVPDSELAQLVRGEVIGPGALLCPEGGTAWQPFNPDDFPKVEKSPAPPAVSSSPEEPASLSPVDPNATGRAEITLALNFIAGMCAIGAAWFAKFSDIAMAKDNSSMAFRAAGFVGVLVEVVLLPFLIAYFVHGLGRPLLRTGAIIVLSLIVVLSV